MLTSYEADNGARLVYDAIGNPRGYRRGPLRETMKFSEMMLIFGNDLAFSPLQIDCETGNGQETLAFYATSLPESLRATVEAAHECRGTVEGTLILVDSSDKTRAIVNLDASFVARVAWSQGAAMFEITRRQGLREQLPWPVRKATP